MKTTMAFLVCTSGVLGAALVAACGGRVGAANRTGNDPGTDNVAGGSSGSIAASSTGTNSSTGGGSGSLPPINSAGSVSRGSSGAGVSKKTALAVAASRFDVDAFGPDHTCALVSDHSVECWGDNTAGQLGDGMLGNGMKTVSATPVAVSNLTEAIDIAAANARSCALLSNGTVACWGWHLISGTDDSVTPAVMPNLNGATAISAGNYHTCALLSNGTVACWGSNGSGQLGDGTTTDSMTPVTVSNLRGVTAISARCSRAAP